MGFNFNLERKPYSAGTAGGIRFWMKSNVPVAVDFPVAATMPRGTGSGTCVDSAYAIDCSNHFHYVSQPIPGEWSEYDVPFAALRQGTVSDTQGNTLFGSAAWDPSVLVGVQFRVPLVETASQLAFDVCVDDVRFYDCSGSDCLPTCTDADAPVSCPAVGRTPAGCWPTGTICSSVQVLVSSFTDVWGSGPNDVWTVGGANVKGTGAGAHWDGSAWFLNYLSDGMRAVWGSGLNDFWVVGDQGVAIHKERHVWQVVLTGTTATLQSVWGSGPDDVWAVGHNGTIVHWDGSRWLWDGRSPTTHSLLSVSGSGPDDAWAVGVSDVDMTGVTLHWDGGEWWVSNSDPRQVMFGVWSNGRNDAWAVGWGIVRWNGSAWTHVSSPIDTTSDVLLGVWGSGADDVWAVGRRGLILHWDGAGWTELVSGTTADLFRVWGSGANDVWAVGERGTIVHWNGTSWSPVPASEIRLDFVTDERRGSALEVLSGLPSSSHDRRLH
jgi:hypothetical protein